MHKKLKKETQRKVFDISHLEYLSQHRSMFLIQSDEYISQ